ncbi:ABC transporter permease [Haloplasma contractile]|uniref:ABC transporter permease protein n=1 Tax=Haloplasma contractile SSD-17B TaxID=1033810 RepID=U2FRR9_9MOLU|nr:ABC transporter permease [Haloplasma contractile]ERJ13659.1 ABC transporter permease protein [Haloplasma contractile SSD-17B]
MNENITYLSVLYLFIPVLLFLFFNLKLQLGISKKSIIAIIRMFIQLSLVGLFLQYLFDYNNWLINIAYIFIMILVASITTINSTLLVIKKHLLPIFSAIFIVNITMLVYFNYLVIDLTNIFTARYLIPIAGMIIGNSLSGNIIAIDRFYKNIKDNQKKYFTTLSLSTSRYEALRPYFRSAIKASVNPTIASIETIGLVALPGMMTGQILGGSAPMTAILYQIAIMIAILIVRYFTAILTILFTIRKSFNDYDVLDL